MDDRLEKDARARIAIVMPGPFELAHGRTALDHLIWHPPGTERHPQIVAWVTAVLERLG